MNLKHLIDDVNRLAEEISILFVTSEADPNAGGLRLSNVERSLYDTHADVLDKNFESAFKVLSFLKEKLGYERIKSDTNITAHYRPRRSHVLLKYFDGARGKVIGVDEMGRPWVQFPQILWQKAIWGSKTKSTGPSPFESGEFENVQPRMKALRLDPEDVQSYRQLLAKIGYISIGEVESKNWDNNLPPVPPDPEEVEEDEDDISGFEAEWAEEPKREAVTSCMSCEDGKEGSGRSIKHVAYFYDP